MDIEAFIITNGRSTFKYALQSLEEQKEKIKITVIRDMKWADAVNECVKLCKSLYFVRVDDDMFLHSLCVPYMFTRIQRSKRKGRICAYTCRLWEDWQQKIAGRVKIYNNKLVKKMGGFKVNKFGKMDKPFSATARKRNLLVVKNDSIVGVHAGAPWEEQKKYRQLWENQNTSGKPSKTKEYLLSQKRYKRSLEAQFKLLNSMEKKNKREKTGFYNFMKAK